MTRTYLKIPFRLRCAIFGYGARLRLNVFLIRFGVRRVASLQKLRISPSKANFEIGSKKIIIAFFIFIAFESVFAQTLPPEVIIKDLLRQIQELQNKILELRSRSAPALNPPVLISNLQRGTGGSEVRLLQEFLLTLPGIYPEKLVTGYFGSLTERAVKKFQERNGIEMTGVVGPLTRAKINEFLLKSVGVSGAIPAGRPVSPVIEKIITDQPLNLVATTAPVQLVATTTLSQLQLWPKPSYDLSRLALRTQEVINRKREEAFLATLLWDDSLARVAYEHSKDQAGDNVEITNPFLLCHYPLIRHEGFISGFTLKERLENSSISYRTAGENIAILPVIKNFIYEYPAEISAPTCPEIEEFKSEGGTKEEITSRYNAILTLALGLVRGLKPVKWVNQEWSSPEEVAKKVVAGWLNSEGHRKNIMNASFNLGGVGIVEVNNYLIFTHNFIGK